MRLDLYGLKRFVRRPLAARRRRQEGPNPFLELHGYSRGALDIAVAKRIDPDHLHRADLDDTAVVLDVGAYRGDGAAQIHALYGCRVYGFEPNPGAFSDLEARFASVPDVTALPYGLGPRNEQLDLHLSGPGSSVYDLDNPTGAATTVELRDVVEVFAELGLDRVDLLKVNIEGGEYDLLDRMFEAGLMDRVRYLLVQFHEWHPKAHRRRFGLRRRLRRSHELVWDYPWLFELWCARSAPHPRVVVTDELRAAVAAQARARAAQSGD